MGRIRSLGGSVDFRLVGLLAVLVVVAAACLPVAVIETTPSPATGNPPLTVQFNGSGSYDRDQGGSIVAYEWDFGDGTTSTGSFSPSHTYTEPGIYTATLWVTDADGEVSPAETVEVTVVSPGD